jgi:hypothetical protein
MPKLQRSVRILALLGLSLLAYYGFRFEASVRVHEQRVAKAKSQLRTFTEGDWRMLYNHCIASYASDLSHESNWPKVIQGLAPYWVRVEGDLMSMSWTGGFDEQPLYLFVQRRRSRPADHVDSEPAGIRIEGPSFLPERPYVVRD